MTICIAVKVHDCIAFVADSASSIVNTDASGQQAIMRVYDNGHKLFNLVRGLPVAGMTCGLGNFGNSSISTIAKEIRKDLTDGLAGKEPESLSIEEIARYVHKKFEEKHDALDAPIKANSSFTFFVGGYSSKSQGSELWKIAFVGDKREDPEMVSGVDDCTIAWDGQPKRVLD